MQKSLIILGLSGLLCSGAMAAQAPAGGGAKPQPAAARPAADQAVKWEYLLVSFGKTYFSDPKDDPETLTSGLSKLAAFAKAGFITANEALVTQRQLDKLGEYEWELVGIVGTIGGDQQMVFKRPLDLQRSSREAQEIAEQGRRLEEVRKAAEERRKAQPPAEVKAELVDLDQVDAQAAVAQERAAKEKRIQEAVATLTGVKVTELHWNWTHPVTPRVSLTIDGTAELLKSGNQYRKSEADKLAQRVMASLIEAAKLTKVNLSIYTHLTIFVRTTIDFGKEQRGVGFAHQDTAFK